MYIKTYTRKAEVDKICHKAVSLQLYGHGSQYLARRTFLGQKVWCDTALFRPRIIKAVYKNGQMIAWGCLVEQMSYKPRHRDMWRYVKPGYRNQGIGTKLKRILGHVL